ncbi:MAG TPA: phosphoribosylglycinamide formyltransferase, partial [Chitinophagaceae bacterium]|nr:phosphoribosylglycinamide formyltransferase [Chitinophagaceae bacterium]
ATYIMFQRLQQKWKVNGLQLVLILCTFAIGGSLTGYVGKKLMNLFSIDQKVLWIVIYIIIVTLLWPLAVLLVSIPFGQFRFFTGYLKKMGRRVGVRSSESGVKSQKSESNDRSAVGDPLPTPDSRLLTRIAIFASGAGSNAQKIIDHFRNSDHIRVVLIVCNKPGAGVLTIAAKENIPALLIDKEKFFRGNGYTDELKENNIAFIILAGFLWKIPDTLINAYPGKIINIHPALLPNYGGKGMYGNYVHEAVIAAGDKVSGITIHYVDGHYDNGDIIFQARCPVLENDTAASLANRIHQLEHEHYPKVIEKLINKELKE